MNKKGILVLCLVLALIMVPVVDASFSDITGNFWSWLKGLFGKQAVGIDLSTLPTTCTTGDGSGCKDQTGTAGVCAIKITGATSTLAYTPTCTPYGFVSKGKDGKFYASCPEQGLSCDAILSDAKFDDFGNCTSKVYSTGTKILCVKYKVIPPCIDTDPAEDLFIKGKCTDSDELIEDRCLYGQVNKVYCAGNECYYSKFGEDCPSAYTCSNGICISTGTAAGDRSR